MNTLSRRSVRQHVARLAGGVFLACCALYSACMLETVRLTALRAEANRGLEEGRARVAHLESRYLALNAAITPQAAEGLGFVSPASSATLVVGTAPSRTAHNGGQ